MKRRASLLVICLLIVSAVVVSRQFHRTPEFVPFDMSLLTPGTNCTIGIASPEAAESDSYRGYAGVVAYADQHEVVLHDAVYQELADAENEIHRNIGTVHIPVHEIAVIQCRGGAASDPDDSLERIGVQFR